MRRFIQDKLESGVNIKTINGDSVLGGGNMIVSSSPDVKSASSGVFTGGALSIGAGGAGVATTFTIALGTGQIVDNTVNPSTVTPVSWVAQTNIAVTNILTQLVTFVAIDSGGNVIQSATDFTPSQMRQYVVIGVVVHSNQTTVNAVNQAQIVAYNQGNQLTDLMYSIGLFNQLGNVFSGNGANLKLNKSVGAIFRRGANYTTLSNNPHLVTTASLTQAPFRMQNQTGAGGASVTDIDVANYDLAGVTTAISPATRFSILRIFLFQSNLIAVQRGQATYQSLAEAKAAIQTEPYVTNSVLASNGLLRGFLVVQANATDLTVAAKAFFIEAGKFGGSSGVGGLSVSTMQNTYDNSADPEILTDATRGAVTYKRGSAADTDDVIEVLNGAGVQKMAVTGNGKIFTSSETASRVASINAGQELESLDTATYPSLTELSYVKGATSSLQAQINTKEPIITNGYGITGTTTKGVLLTSTEAFCTAETTLSASTYADITGASITLDAGTWLILATANGASQTTTATSMLVAITTAANDIIAEATQDIAAGTATVRTWGNLAMSAIVSPGVSTTYKLRGARARTTRTGNCIISDGTGLNVANNLSDNSDKSTSIRAVRIA